MAIREESLSEEHVEPLLRLEPGTPIGVSDWVLIEQDMVDQFAELTRDPDPLHIDPEWARANGPFGGTTAFGFLTISLLTHMFRTVIEHDLRETDLGLFLNYGFDRLRLVSPVPVGKRIRARFTMGDKRADANGRWIVRFLCEVEVEGGERPALVCEWLSAWVPPPSA
jgi:acyl dehydratase